MLRLMSTDAVNADKVDYRSRIAIQCRFEGNKPEISTCHQHQKSPILKAWGFSFSGAKLGKPTIRGLIMAKLTTNARKKLPKKDYAGPGESYPIPDASHAANAKARATQMENEGKLSPSANAKIDAKANKVIAKDKPKAKAKKK